MNKRLNYLWTILVLAALLLSACGAEATAVLPETGPEATEVPAIVTAAPAATEAAPEETAPPATATAAAPEPTAAPTTAGGSNDQLGGSVTVLGHWSGTDLENFLAVLAPFEAQTGIDVEFEDTRDVATFLAASIKDGSLPDIAVLPSPGALRQYAAQGMLAPLDDVVDITRLQEEYPEGFTDLTQVEGQTYGVFAKASVKNLIWYRPDVFQERGYQVPQTWEELQTLEQQIISEGATPWCVGVESGWPGTDWVEALLLRTAGPETYDAWWEHAIPWTDPAVAGAWEAWGRIVGDPAMVHGGPAFVLSHNGGEASFVMLDEEPGCFLHQQASFFTTFIADQDPEVQFGEELNFFPFPPIDEQHGNPLLVAGDLFGMFNDTPQARALMEYLTTAEAQTLWAEKGGYIAPNQAVSPAVYPDDITSAIAQLYVEAESVRFDASDLMPKDLQTAFTSGTWQFIREPDSLQTVLETIEATAQEAAEQ